MSIFELFRKKEVETAPTVVIFSGGELVRLTEQNEAVRTIVEKFEEERTFTFELADTFGRSAADDDVVKNHALLAAKRLADLNIIVDPIIILEL